MENIIIIETGHIIAFIIGLIFGMLTTTVFVGLMIPTWVGDAFKNK